MKSVKQVTTFCLLLATLCGCEEQSITRQEPTTANNPAVANSAPAALGGIVAPGPILPSPTIIAQTYIPTNSLFAHTRCRAWRITWPTYPVGTSRNLIPTMFSLKDGLPYSFNFLNNTSAANTYKTDFNLYHDNKVASVFDMWEDLTHLAVDKIDHDKLGTTKFNRSKYTAAQVETWVKGRPELFELKWEETIDTDSEFENYKQGDIYQFRLVEQNRYGGIRIVSMTPRIIEVYLAEPNP